MSDEVKSVYETIEDTLSEMLNSATITAKPLPDNETEFNKNFTKPVVHVCYSSSEFGEPESIGIMVQEETMMFDLLFRVKSRRGSTGLLSIVSSVQSSVIGHKLPGYDRMQLVKQGYIDGTQNNWNYVLTISMVGHVAQEEDDEETLGTFGKNVTVSNDEIVFSND